jgi:uncharacterized damage-inducible protein DinB
MKKAALVFAAAVCATTAHAQQAPPAPSIDMAGSLKQQHLTIRKYLLGAAERMPDADFHFKPQGTTPEVRTFGQIVAHLANANYAICAVAKAEKPPNTPLDDQKETKPKAELVKALTDALTYCDTVYDSQTTATLTEMMKRQLPNNVTVERARGNSLISNLSHNNEHYGNLVTYLRAKGLVPPSSDR